jgi:hypothetical protein
MSRRDTVIHNMHTLQLAQYLTFDQELTRVTYVQKLSEAIQAGLCLLQDLELTTAAAAAALSTHNQGMPQ